MLVGLKEIDMNLNKTKILLEDFPELYKQSTLSPMETCMCWGFECGDGWFDLIYNLSKDIVNISKDIQAVQVKEKFGGLRFYWTGTNTTDEQNTKIDELVEKAEMESYKICEKCGSKDGVKQTKEWIVTICKKCISERHDKKESDNVPMSKSMAKRISIQKSER